MNREFICDVGITDFLQFLRLNFLILIALKLKSTLVIFRSSIRCMDMYKFTPQYFDSRKKNAFLISEPKWTNLNVTYYLFNYSVNIGTHMTKLQVDADLKTSLEFWSNASALTFTKLPSPEVFIPLISINYHYIKNELFC